MTLSHDAAEVIYAVCWTVGFCFAVQGVVVYALVRLVATGQGVFVRKGDES